MNIDKKILYTVSAFYIGVLLLVCFIPNEVVSNIVFAFFSAVAASLVYFVIKKRSVLHIEKKQVALVMGALAVIQIVLFYLTGLRFGFYKTPVLPEFIWEYILPYAVIIVSSELMRAVMLAQKNKITSILFYFSYVLLDIGLLSHSGRFSSFDNLTEMLTLILFPALTANLLYAYLSAKYGMLPNTVYKLLMLIYPYLFPTKPQMPDIMIAFLRTLIPIGILLLFRMMYEPKRFVVSRKLTWLKVTLSSIACVLLAGFVMLISCQFRYSLILIGSGSMADEIDTGDAVIYERYDGEIIENGDIIVFKKEGTTIIHRVVDIKKINGEMRYYTKGDANDSMDSGYITNADVVGKVNLKIKYVGYPSIWARSLFK